mgnify:CR=1 FL=1
MFVHLGSSRPDWPVLESRAHEVGGWSRVVTWYFVFYVLMLWRRDVVECDWGFGIIVFSGSCRREVVRLE